MADREQRARVDRFVPAGSGTYPAANEQTARPGVDYPRSGAEFDALFPNERACLRFLERLRWPRGFRCHRCGSRDTPSRAGRLLLCGSCGWMSAVTEGTIFHGSAHRVQQWFRLIWTVAGQRFGTRMETLRKALGLSDLHLWLMLEQLHRGMAVASGDLLRGSVELGKTMVEVPADGGSSRRSSVRRMVVAIAAERGVDEPQRMRVRRVDSVTSTEIVRFAADVIQPGTAVFTGRWHGYGGLSDVGFSHAVSSGVQSSDRTVADLPAVQEVASLLRLWLWSVPECTELHLGYYLDEFAFRYNHRSASDGLIFYQLLHWCCRVEPVSNAQTAGESLAQRKKTG